MNVPMAYIPYNTKCSHSIYTIQYKILEGENFGETVHTKIWWIIFWQMPKISKVPKIIVLTFNQSVRIMIYFCGVWFVLLYINKYVRT